MPVRHAPHLCYHCGCTILKDQAETQVESLKGLTVIRYQHATEEGCQAALNRQVSYNTGRDPEDDAENMYQGKHRG